MTGRFLLLFLLLGVAETPRAAHLVGAGQRTRVVPLEIARFVVWLARDRGVVLVWKCGF